MTPIRGEDGFTLLEVLVAIAVFALVQVGLWSGISYALRAWDHQKRDIATRESARAAETTLRRLIAHSDPGTPMQRLPFLCAEDRISFVTTLRGDGAPSDLPVQVAIGRDEHHRLVARWQPFVDAVPLHTVPPPAESVLAEGVEALTLSYEDITGNWQSTCHAGLAPLAIRATIRFRDTATVWPVIEQNIPHH